MEPSQIVNRASDFVEKGQAARRQPKPRLRRIFHTPQGAGEAGNAADWPLSTKSGKIVAVCTSPRKGMRKANVGRARVVEGFGLEGDAHGGNWHRQISLLSIASIDKMRGKGLDVGPGDFAENITVLGLDFLSLPLGTCFAVGPSVILELTQIGKKCHTGCLIMQSVGDCVMPKEGIFSRVVRGGEIQVGDAVLVLEKGSYAGREAQAV